MSTKNTYWEPLWTFGRIQVEKTGASGVTTGKARDTISGEEFMLYEYNKAWQDWAGRYRYEEGREAREAFTDEYVLALMPEDPFAGDEFYEFLG